MTFKALREKLFVTKVVENSASRTIFYHLDLYVITVLISFSLNGMLVSSTITMNFIFVFVIYPNLKHKIRFSSHTFANKGI